jgi:hypothetical protein
MSHRIVAAAVALVASCVGAAAFVSPGPDIGAPRSQAITIADPGQPGAKRGAAPIRRSAPTVIRRSTTIQKPAVSVRQAPRVVTRNVTKIAPKIVTRQAIVKSPIVKAPIVKGGGGALPTQFVHVRSFRKHKYYGRAIGGIIIGSILAASAYYTYAYAYPPAPGLCWYWTNSDRERGYWDYCDPPDEDDED